MKVIAELSQRYGKEEKENENAEELHQRPTERLGKE